MLLWILGPLALLLLTALAIGWSVSAPGYSGESSDHFKSGRFVNQGNVEAKGFVAVFQWMLKRDQGPWAKNYETETGSKPVDSTDRLTITFVNHSTFLIQWNGLNLLTDPIWSERCSPFSFVGPQRMRPPGIAFEDLPEIDIVLISHNHYDHLDVPTLERIEESWSPLFIVPLGVKAMLDQKGMKNSIELDWWQQTATGIHIKSMPAQHFSGRGMFDRDKTLWCGYLLEHEGKKLYFAGDTGYGDFFKEIGKKEGPMDVSIIPVGAYMPEWFMSPIHISPQEAIQVHQDVKSQQSIAMHFGTFPLADDGQGKAEEELILGLDSLGVDQSHFIIPEEGKALKF